MISLEKWKILRPLQKLPNNVGDLAKLMVAKGFKKLPKVQKIAKSGHTGHYCQCWKVWLVSKLKGYLLNVTKSFIIVFVGPK